jgi:uncharacterized coiled-coil protein SlyX
MSEKCCCPFCAGLAIGERFARLEQRMAELEQTNQSLSKIADTLNSDAAKTQSAVDANPVPPS